MNAKITKAKEVSAIQTYIDPELAPPTNQQIDMQAEKFLQARESIADLKDAEFRAKHAIIELMQQEGIEEYIFGSGGQRYRIVLQDETSVKIKRLKIRRGEDL